MRKSHRLILTFKEIFLHNLDLKNHILSYVYKKAVDYNDGSLIKYVFHKINYLVCFYTRYIFSFVQLVSKYQ